MPVRVQHFLNWLGYLVKTEIDVELSYLGNGAGGRHDECDVLPIDDCHSGQRLRPTDTNKVLARSEKEGVAGDGGGGHAGFAEFVFCEDFEFRRCFHHVNDAFFAREIHFVARRHG